jgi:hypothetical protein
LKVPQGTDWTALAGALPLFLSYVLSFVYVAIYWNNHHHMLHASKLDQRRRALGQPASAVLAFSDSLSRPPGWMPATSQRRRWRSMARYC